MRDKIVSFLLEEGMEWIYFVDISNLSEEYNKNYPAAVLFGKSLSKKYLRKVAETKDYVKNMVRNGLIEQDEFHLTELKTDTIADKLADWLVSEGFNAYSQSEQNVLKTGYFDERNNRTPLPHKAIALRAGLGWIGNNNLLVTENWGCAVSMCSVLTDIPLKTILHEIQDSRCGNCNICKNICPTNAISGKKWTINTDRDHLINVSKCITCLKCMVLCPFSIKYYQETK